MSGFELGRRASEGSPVSIFASGSSTENLTFGDEQRTITPIFISVEPTKLDAGRNQAHQLQRKVTHLTRSMHHNLQSVLQRGSSLGDLEDKVSNLEMSSKGFSRTATAVDEKLWRKEHWYSMAAIYALIALSLIFIAYIVIKRFLWFSLF